jgi:hypothetical protein
MLTRFFKAKPIFSFDELKGIPAKTIEVHRAKDSHLGKFIQSGQLESYWLDSIYGDLKSFSLITDAEELRLVLRKKTVTALELVNIYCQILKKERTELESKEIWMRLIDEDDKNTDFALQLSHVNSITYDASIHCYRKISWDLNDASNDDWFSCYDKVYAVYAGLLCDAIIGDLHGTPGLLNMMIPTAQAKVNELRSVVLAGGQIYAGE